MRISVDTTSNPEKKWGIRHIIGTMGFLTTVLTYIHRFCLSLAIIEMVRFHSKGGKIDTQTCPLDLNTTTIKQYTGEFDWDEETQGIILSSFFWGYVIMSLLGGLMVLRGSVKWVLGCSMLASTCGSLLTPIVSRTFGSLGLICLRILIGIGQGPVYPALNVMMSHWCPVNERGLFGALIFAGAFVGNFLSMALSGLIITFWSWPGVFYVYGGLGIAWLIVWVIVYHNTPSEHPFIKEEERKYITTTSGKTCYKDLPSIPWIPILTSIPLWGLIIAQIGHDWGLFTIITDLPKYIKSVLHVSILENGAISGLPHLGMWLFAILSGWAIDLLVVKFKWSMSIVRKLCITVASFGPAAGIIAASYSGCDKTLVIVFFVFGMTIMGSYVPGAKPNTIDLSPNYSAIVMALVGGIGAASGIVTPYLVGILTPNSTLLEWRLLFWISVAVLIGTNIAYLIMGTAKTQWWNDPDSVRKYHEKEKSIKKEAS